MATAGSDPDGYIRCLRALHFVTSQSIPCVDNVLQRWHQQQIIGLQPCSRPRPRPASAPQECSVKGKPKSSSCQNCVAWGKAVEDTYYPQHDKGKMPWGNINPILLSTSHVEVAKAFVLRLQSYHDYTKLEQFDSASLLMIMMRFADFHKGDQIKFDIIKKISDARNRLCHMALEDNQSLNDREVEDIFNDINDFISCLETLYPQWFTTARDIRLQLDEIKLAPVTAKIRDEILEPFRKSMEDAVRESIAENMAHKVLEPFSKSMEKVVYSSINQECINIQETQDYLHEKLVHQVERIPSSIEELSQQIVKAGINTKQMTEEIHHKLEQLPEVVHFLHQEERERLVQSGRQGKDSFDIDTCRNQLMAEYRHTRSKLPLLPGMPEEFADMDDLYVNLVLLKEVKAPTMIEEQSLDCPTDLFTLTDKRGNFCKRILVIGGPGSGKSSTISKLAYDWATDKNIPELKKYQLLFALDIREIYVGMDLIDVIQDQLLPKISKEGLLSYIQSNAKLCAFLLDGFDERPDVLKQEHFKYMLSSKWLQESLVIVTTRPYKKAEFVNSYGVYIFITISTWSNVQVQRYVARFFQITSFEQVIRSAFLERTSVEVQKVRDFLEFRCRFNQFWKNVCQIPITLSMMCLLWTEDKQIFSQCITRLYDNVVLLLARHNEVKYEKRNDSDTTTIEQVQDNVLIAIGKVALSGLLQNKQIFSCNEFDKSILETACLLGILSKERKRSKLNLVQHVTFFHKTFQEYCAAIYLVSFCDKSPEKLTSFLQQINIDNVCDMKMLLLFSCGKSPNAAEFILPHIVQLSYKSINHNINVTEYHLYISDYRRTLPLEMLYEANVSHLHTHLLPLFQKHLPTTITISNYIHMSVTPTNTDYEFTALDFFLDCVLNDTSSINEIFQGVTEVVYEYSSYISDLQIKILLKLLTGMTNLQKLEMFRINDFLLVDIILHSMVCKEHIRSMNISGSQFTPTILSLLLKQMTSLEILTLGNNRATTSWDHWALYVHVQYSEPNKLIALDRVYPIMQLRTHSNTVHVDILCPLIPSLKTLRLRSYIPNSQCEKLFSLLVEAGRESNSEQGGPNTIKRKTKDTNQTAYLPCECLELTYLNVPYNAVYKLNVALRYLGNLNELRLHQVNFLGGDRALLVWNVGKFLTKLTKLELSSSNIGRINESMKGLEFLTSVTHLNLSNTCLSKSNVLEVCHSLANMPDLKELCLGNNNIGKAMANLSNGLKHLQKIEKLDLTDTNITDKGIHTLPLMYLKKLRVLRISGKIQNYGPNGISHLFRSLHHAMVLEHLAIKYSIDWNKSNSFLAQYYQKCSLKETKTFDNARYTERKLHNQSLVIYANEYIPAAP